MKPNSETVHKSSGRIGLPVDLDEDPISDTDTNDRKTKRKTATTTTTTSTGTKGSLFDYFARKKPEAMLDTDCSMKGKPPKILQLPRAESLSQQLLHLPVIQKKRGQKRKRAEEAEEEKKRRKIEISEKKRTSLVIIGDEESDEVEVVKSPKKKEVKRTRQERSDESIDLELYEAEEEEKPLDILFSDEDEDFEHLSEKSSNNYGESRESTKRAVKKREQPVKIDLVQEENSPVTQATIRGKETDRCEEEHKDSALLQHNSALRTEQTLSSPSSSELKATVQEIEQEDQDVYPAEDPFDIGVAQLLSPQESQDVCPTEDPFDIGVYELLSARQDPNDPSQDDDENVFSENFDIGLDELLAAFTPRKEDTNTEPQNGGVRPEKNPSNFGLQGHIKTSFSDFTLAKKPKKFNLCKR